MSWQFGGQLGDFRNSFGAEGETEGMRDGVAFKVTVRMGEMVESGGEEG